MGKIEIIFWYNFLWTDERGLGGSIVAERRDTTLLVCPNKVLQLVCGL